MIHRLIILLWAFALAQAGPAAAQMSDLSCDDTARVTQRLTDVLRAERQGRGLRGPDAVLEVWIEPDTGDWTLVQNYANGTSCIVALGQHWESLTPANPA